MLNENYKRGMICWCDLGGSIGREQSGKRLIVITSNNIGNEHSPVVIGVAGTSQIGKAKLPTHFTLDKGKYNLKYDTLIMTEQVRTLDKNRLGDIIGCLDDEDIQKLDRALKISLQLDKTNAEHINTIKGLKKDIEEIDTIVKHYIYKNKDIRELRDELITRNSFLCELKSLCKQYNLKYYKIYDESKVNNLLLNFNKSRIKEMVV